MIATDSSFEPHSSTQLPNSRKVFVPGELHADIRVPMREIDLEPSANEPPIRVYDTSGIYSDPAAASDIRTGLPE
jgi:phosphomethylpyrimidine synthase